MPLLPDKTQSQFGYLPDTLPKGSAKPVVYACDQCGTVLERQYRRMTSPALCHPCHMAQPRSTEWKTKFKATMVERYGAPTALQSPQLLEKMKAREREQHGGENVSQRPDVRQKRRRPCTPDHPAHHPNVLRDATKERYGYAPSTLSAASPAYVVCRCERCQTVFERDMRHIKAPVHCATCCHGLMSEDTKKRAHQQRQQTNHKRYGVNNPLADRTPTGRIEAELRIRIEALGHSVQSNVRLPSGKELDVVVPAKRLAIEYCGLRWHCEHFSKNDARLRHRDKLQEAEAEGLTLITIFEDEWIRRQAGVWNYLLSKLSPAQQRVYARNCDVRPVSLDLADLFLTENHIQGQATGTLFAVGIYQDAKLLGVMTFGRHQRQRHDDVIVLSRLAFLPDTCIIGGASRLLKAAQQHPLCHTYTKIISWSDSRYSQGNVYRQLGFTLTEELPPDYSYVNLRRPGIRLSKQSQKKSLTHCPPELTEREWAEQHGLSRIWDCGKRRWELPLARDKTP